jgi:hypothetical protein
MVDGFAKRREMLSPVIPAKAGIQCFLMVGLGLDSRLRGNDDFLRVHQGWHSKSNPIKKKGPIGYRPFLFIG